MTAEPNTPATLAEFNALYHQRVKYDGEGITTRVSLPCPGCAAPDFIDMHLRDTQTAWAKGATCAACGRGFRMLFSGRHSPSQTFEIVQTHGADLPAWAPPIRRTIAPLIYPDSRLL